MKKEKKYFSLLLNEYMVSDVKQTEIHIAKPLVPNPNPFEVEADTARHNTPGSHEVPAELIQAGGEALWSVIHTFVNSIRNKEELPVKCEESISVAIYKKGNKTDCGNYHGISLLSISYKILPKNFLSRLIPYIDKIIGNHQCGFSHNRTATDQIFLHPSDTVEKMGV
jgi:hypothetical protein